MIREKQWFAVFTRPACEKKVDAQLIKKGFETYCPLQKSSLPWSSRKKTVLQPLFPSFVFVHVKERDHRQVKQTEGVLSLICWLKKPAVIKDGEIESMREFLNAYPQVQLEKITVKRNDPVCIIHDPLLSRQGNIVEVRQNTVKLILPSLGYALLAQRQHNDSEAGKELPDHLPFTLPSKSSFTERAASDSID